MKKNMGVLDKLIRFIIAISLFSLWFIAQPPVKFVAFAGFVPLLTGLLNFCPLYALIGIKTCKAESSQG
ncbi:MAG: DUF2892 domain-containing protein [Chitinivibrionales bacterium]|nr:DUF2892 domain-containing protein [Chitinivibrionales bacterium]